MEASIQATVEQLQQLSPTESHSLQPGGQAAGRSSSDMWVVLKGNSVVQPTSEV